jgi:hypothetical protein
MPSDAYANTILDNLFLGGGNLYLVLSTTAPGENATGVTRPTDSAYTDTEVPATTAAFAAAVNRETVTVADIVCPAPEDGEYVLRGFGWALTQGGDPIEAGPTSPVRVAPGSNLCFPSGLIAGRA